MVPLDVNTIYGFTAIMVLHYSRTFLRIDLALSGLCEPSSRRPRMFLESKIHDRRYMRSRFRFLGMVIVWHLFHAAC